MPGAAAQRPFVADAQTSIDSDLAAAILAEILLANAEAAILLARISEDVELRTVMFGLHKPSDLGAI